MSHNRFISYSHDLDGTLAPALQALGDLAWRQVELERALAISEAALGPDHPTVAAWRNNLGSVLWALGDLDGARAQLERALAIGEAALGREHPDVALYRRNLAGMVAELGKPGEGL